MENTAAQQEWQYPNPMPKAIEEVGLARVPNPAQTKYAIEEFHVGDTGIGYPKMLAE